MLRDLKSFAAKRLFELVETHPQESRRDWLLYQLQYFGKPHGQAFKGWQDGSHPIALHDVAQTKRCQHYIRFNPVVARIVTEPEHYVFSSACPDQLLPLADLEVLKIRVVPIYRAKWSTEPHYITAGWSPPSSQSRGWSPAPNPPTRPAAAR